MLSCPHVVTGRVAEGGACGDDFECGDEAHCFDLDSCPGSCIVYSSGCGDGPECPLDQQCRHEAGGSSCVARAALGEACGDAATSSCVRALVHGEPCAADLECLFDSCEDGLCVGGC